MHIHTLRCEMLVNRSIADTFSIFENPYNLARITPSWLGLKVVSTTGLNMQSGTEIDYTIRWLGLPLRWKTVIREYERPYMFIDEQAKGPYSLWRHRHTFVATDEGTTVRDHVDYALPFGMAGNIAHSLIVRKQLTEIFRFRQRELPKLLNAKTVELVEPDIT